MSQEATQTTLKGGFRTILEDSNVYHVKHPLQTHWTLHQKIGSVASQTSSRAVSQSEWEEKLKESVTIGTVEDFWCLYNEMQAIETIPTNCDYFFMREGVKPMWEDPANVGGGELRISINKSMDSGRMWRDALLFAVGCQATHYEPINGLQFAFRQNRNRLSIWLGPTSSAALDEIREQFNSTMCQAAGQDANVRVEYFPFAKTPHGGSSRSHGSSSSAAGGGSASGYHRSAGSSSGFSNSANSRSGHSRDASSRHSRR